MGRLPSASVLPSVVPSLLPSSQPTACFDLNLEEFSVTKYKKNGDFREKTEKDRTCVNLKTMNPFTIEWNCADNNIILNDCKLTCGNCATSSPSSVPSAVPSLLPSSQPSSIPSVLPSTVPSGLPSVVPSSTPSSVPSTTPSRLPSVLPSV